MGKKKTHKPVRVGNFGTTVISNNETNGDRNKNLSIKQYQDKIKPNHTDLQKSDIWKIQLAIAYNFIPPKDSTEST